MTPTATAELEHSAHTEYDRLLDSGTYDGPAYTQAVEFANEVLQRVHAVAADREVYELAWYRLVLDHYHRLLSAQGQHDTQQHSGAEG